MASKNKSIVKSKEKIHEIHLQYKPYLKTILSSFEDDIKSHIQLISMPSYKTRVKSFNSYYRKLIKLDKISENNDFVMLSDMLGIRIICHFLEDVNIIEHQLCSAYEVIEIEKKGADRNFSNFGYESTHLLIKIPPEIISNVLSESNNCDNFPKEIICEVQIRTMLQDAWAEVEHELVYKAEFSPFDLPLRRKLYSMNATLSLAEIIFQEIRDYQNKMNTELEKRRLDFYEQADILSLGKLDADSVMTDSFSPKFSMSSASPFVKGTIDDLLLEALQAHNLGNLEKAIAIYTKILESAPKPNNIIMSVIHKHRGMAYFAQNDYENAKSDFIKSTECDTNNARSFYYAGIVCSVSNNEQEALDFFEKSLSINPYQAHVRYRKALSLYHLSLFDLAHDSLEEASLQGLGETEYAHLKEKLEAKRQG